MLCRYVKITAWNCVSLKIRRGNPLASSTKTKIMAKSRILDILAQRRFAYQFLKRAFIEESSADFVTLLIEENLLEAFPGADEPGDVKAGVDDINFYLRDPDVLTTDGLARLETDFVNLFIGVGRVKAPPWESVYRSASKLIYQEHTIEVRNEYARQNLAAAKLGREPDDHIALELDFMATLSERAAEALRRDQLSKAKRELAAQKKFLKEHPGAWARQFAGKVSGSAETGFYRGLASVLVGFVQNDAKVLDELIDQVSERIKQDRAKPKTP